MESIALDERVAGQTPLPLGVIHEWFAEGDPPLCLLAHFVRRARAQTRAGVLAVWIGRSCWPFPVHLGASLRAASFFVDAERPNERLWALDLCLRSPAVAAVVADGRGFDMAATRRLQLAAKRSRTLAMLARPERELNELSAAALRWRVRPVPSPHDHPRWSVELLRCKGLRPAPGPLTWVLEWNDEAGVVVVPADVADRPAAPATQTGRRTA